MKQVAGLISTYSSDEFGICSALYELGGMVVMHDASGCNSTYTTHDEPRWYDRESMIYISAISEMEAIMGDDDKFIQDLVSTAKMLSPRFIAIVGAPIPYMTGIDLDAIARIVERKTGICSFGFPANGMRNYTWGVSKALEKLVMTFCKEEKKEDRAVGILGATPLDYGINGSIESMVQWLLKCGFSCNCTLAMGDSLEDIAGAAKARASLVISYGGLAAAKYLEKTFGIPYVVGAPFGKAFSGKVEQALNEAIRTGKNQMPYQMASSEMRPFESFSAGHKEELVIIGESVYSASLAAAIEMEYNVGTKVICPVDSDEKLLRSQDEQAPEEDDIFQCVKGAKYIIADPLYQPICPENARFYPLGHIAFSGRIYEKTIPNFVNRKIGESEDMR